MQLEALVAALGGSLRPSAAGGAREVEIGDVRLDSRSVGAGDLFAALPGRAADGASFANQAAVRGAAAVLSPAQFSAPLPLPHWVHPQARRIAGEAAALVHARPSGGMRVVAVTGTNGKTTTAHLVGQLYAHVGLRVAVLGTTGHLLADGVRLVATHTTPDAPELQRLLARHRSQGGDAVALELSSHALDQERHAGLELDIGVFTNLSRDHLDYHGDMQRYANAKRRLFEALGPGGCAVVNADDPVSGSMAQAAAERGARVLSFSARSRADLWASRVVPAKGGSRFVLHGMGISGCEVFLPLAGRHNLENALAALAAVLATGASPSHAVGGLAALLPAPGRLEAVATGERGWTLYVDYAHTPDALERVLTTLRAELSSGSGARLICLFGCGGDRDRGKREAMGEVAGRLADVIVVTSDNPRGEDPGAIARAVLAGLGAARGRVEVELDRRAAIARAIAAARAGDVVLLAGKGHETTQTIRSEAIPFDDRAVAREILAGTAGCR